MSNLVIAIIAEGLFLALVGALFRLLITSRKLRETNKLLARRANQIATLHQRLQLTHQHLQVAKEQINQLQNASHPQDDQVLLNYQQRIANLEKFKQLYFELEDRIGDEIDAEEMNRYRERVQELESIEVRLQHELVDYRRRVTELESRRPTAPAHGVVRLKEIEEMSARLQQREGEIRRLRQECETVGLQYEELAMKSLAIAGEGGELTAAQKAQLEELKQKLEENSAALARKKAECEMLENHYLELEENAELIKASEQLQQSVAECDALAIQQLDLHSQVENAVDQDAAEEMAKLRETLVKTEAALTEMRDDYKEIKEQFVEVAQEEGELRQKKQALEQECEALRGEVAALSEVRQELASQQEELVKIRAEYSKMESRYLALVQKHQR